MASKTATLPAVVDEWTALLESAETVEGRAPAADVDVPDSVVAFLTKLREPGANGGKRRAKLPLNGKTYTEVVAVLKAGGKLVQPASSASCKPMFAEEDEIEVVGEDGKTSLELREGAEPIGVYVSVGDRRGAKAANDVQVSGKE